MSSIVINPKSEKELRFISELLQKLGVESKVLSDEDTEDLGLAMLMKEADRSDLASEDEVMMKLNFGHLFRHQLNSHPRFGLPDVGLRYPHIG